MTSYVYSSADSLYCKDLIGLAQLNHLPSLQETQLKNTSTDSISTVDSQLAVPAVLGPKRKNRQNVQNNAPPATATNTKTSYANGSASPASVPGNSRVNCNSSGGYPGVSWNRRMGAWLSFYYDNYCRRSRTFHPKHFNMDVEAARLAAVSFIKTVEGNPRSKRIRRAEKGIRPKSTALVSKSQYISADLAHASTPKSPNCRSMAGVDLAAVAPTATAARGWSPYYVVPNEDYYAGENYWKSIAMLDTYSLPEQLCGYTPNSPMMGFVLPSTGYMNYDNSYYAHHPLPHSCPKAQNLSAAASPSKDYDYGTQPQYVPHVEAVPANNVYTSDQHPDLNSLFYLNPVKCSQPAANSAGFYIDQ